MYGGRRREGREGQNYYSRFGQSIQTFGESVKQSLQQIVGGQSIIHLTDLTIQIEESIVSDSSSEEDRNAVFQSNANENCIANSQNSKKGSLVYLDQKDGVVNRKKNHYRSSSGNQLPSSHQINKQESLNLCRTSSPPLTMHYSQQLQLQTISEQQTCFLTPSTNTPNDDLKQRIIEISSSQDSSLLTMVSQETNSQSKAQRCFKVVVVALLFSIITTAISFGGIYEYNGRMRRVQGKQFVLVDSRYSQQKCFGNADNNAYRFIMATMISFYLAEREEKQHPRWQASSSVCKKDPWRADCYRHQFVVNGVMVAELQQYILTSLRGNEGFLVVYEPYLGLGIVLLVRKCQQHGGRVVVLVGEERFGLQEMQLTLAKYNCLKKVQFLDAKGIGALDNVAKLDYLIGSDTFIEEYVKAKESSKDRTSELASNSWLVVLPEGRPDFLITRMGYGWKDFYIVTENRERDSGIALQKIQQILKDTIIERQCVALITHKSANQKGK